MNNMGKVEKMVQSAPNGIITAAQLTKAGLHRGYLHNFVESGELYRFGRGLYVQSSAREDDFYLLQRKYSRGIYSHDTALYLLGYSDRTPARYTMTFPKGYNAPSLKQEDLIVKRAIPENYDFGIQRQRHSQIDAVRGTTSCEAKSSALHGDFIMITKIRCTHYTNRR